MPNTTKNYLGKSTFVLAALSLSLVSVLAIHPTALAQESGPKEKESARFDSVEDYLAKQDPTKAKTLKSVIDFILAEFPELKAKIAWNVPTIHRDGKYVVGFSAHTNHLSIAPFSSQVLEDFKPRLGKYVVKKNLFQIPVDWEVDKELVKDLVRARLAELD